MKRRKRDGEEEKACGTKEDGWKKRKGLAGKRKMDRVIGTLEGERTKV